MTHTYRHIQVTWHRHTDTYRSCDTDTQTYTSCDTDTCSSCHRWPAPSPVKKIFFKTIILIDSVPAAGSRTGIIYCREIAYTLYGGKLGNNTSFAQCFGHVKLHNCRCLWSEGSKGAKVPWNKSSCNICTWAAKVPQEQKFLNFSLPRERMLHERKVPRERKFSLWSFRSRERKCRGTKRPVTVYTYAVATFTASRKLSPTTIFTAITSRQPVVEVLWNCLPAGVLRLQ